MPAHLTAAQARALGIDAPKTGRPRTTRKTVPLSEDGYHTVCHRHGIHFTTQAAETRHHLTPVASWRDVCCRYDTVLTPGVYGSGMSNVPPPDPDLPPDPDAPLDPDADDK